MRLGNPFRINEPLSRGQYFGWGFALLLIKHNLDRMVAGLVFQREWTIFSYWQQPVTNPFLMADPDRAFFLSLIALSVPFIAVGIVLTIRRLRDAGLSPFWSVLFFAPFVNLLFFLLLTVRPSQQQAVRPGINWLQRVAPASEFGAAAAGVLASALLALLSVFVSVNLYDVYGWGLFIGTPVVMGLTSATFFNLHAQHSMRRTLSLAMLSLGLAAAIIFGLAMEGIFCLAMAAPIAVPLVAIGATAGHCVMRLRSGKPETVMPLVLLLLPGMVAVESALLVDTPIRVTTTIEIVAPPETVWRHVVTFSELPPPQEWYFRHGIAYPQRATIRGQGVGAIRLCEFSTGAFVEPITHWDEPRRLAFAVTAQPAVMHELSFRDLTPPHVADHYLRSQRGEFRLEGLPGGRTRLIGTTWYTLRFSPVDYWQLWSDAIIHRIHQRVLNHIRELSEAPQPVS